MEPAMNDQQRSGCPINLTLEVVGDKWSLLVIRDMMFGNRRHFRELLTKSEEGISSNILADRLKTLLERGIITRDDDPSHKQKGIYSLTEQGIELLPILAQMSGWGFKYLPVSEELGIRAKLLSEGGPKMWAEFMDELRETHLGDWQGMTHGEVDAAAPGARVAWRNDATWAPHGGESRVDVARRSFPLIAELVDSQPDWGADESDRPVVLVAHGGLIAALTARLLGLPVDNWPVLGGMGNASWAQLSGHSAPDAPLDEIRWRLDVWNASAQVAGDVL